jgi:hypothetical protein
MLPARGRFSIEILKMLTLTLRFEDPPDLRSDPRLLEVVGGGDAAQRNKRYFKAGGKLWRYILACNDMATLIEC